MYCSSLTITFTSKFLFPITPWEIKGIFCRWDIHKTSAFIDFIALLSSWNKHEVALSYLKLFYLSTTYLNNPFCQVEENCKKKPKTAHQERISPKFYHLMTGKKILTLHFHSFFHLCLTFGTSTKEYLTFVNGDQVHLLYLWVYAVTFTLDNEVFQDTRIDLIQDCTAAELLREGAVLRKRHSQQHRATATEPNPQGGCELAVQFLSQIHPPCSTTWHLHQWGILVFCILCSYSMHLFLFLS